MQPNVSHVVGARPNFPKAAPVIRALSERAVEQRLIHTGQHYDDNMSAVFFTDLELPEPDVNLGVGSGSHAQQTANIMTALEVDFLENPPALVVVYGDVNSTVAAALVAAKLQIPVAHVEAGLRSRDRSMPEEVNRVVTDRLSALLFATSADAVAHLADEGVASSDVHFVGNPMIDTLLRHREKMDAASVRQAMQLPERYGVTTLHRPANVDDEKSLARLVSALHGVADRLPMVIPAHPRARPAMTTAGLFEHPDVHVVDPLPYLSFVSLVCGASLVVTDSGGIQEETTMLGVPCFTMRPNTERPVTILHGTNRLVEPDQLAVLVAELLAEEGRGGHRSHSVPPLWDGRSGERIAAVISGFLRGQAGPLRLG